MSKHQIIYTSCKRGISGINDGLQIYSYDASFSNYASDNVKSLFAYHTPALAPGVVMTDSIAETMPQSLTYRRLTDNLCAIVLNTYLGRDYMEGGRFGNHLSHAVICDEADFCYYPCEFYDSELLRSRMEPDEVRSAERPPFLPEPELIKGNKVSAGSVNVFLSSDNRMEHYKKMLAAMLAFEGARKRVVICDSTDNIIMWIAALQYALPLEIALNVNFTTYEYDPSLSASQICGVVPEGTRYNADKADIHYTFDFLRNIIPDIEAKGDFFDFMDMSMSMSYDNIQAFHEFIRSKLTYRNPDEQYYHIYSLYCLFTDGLANFSLNAFTHAIQMSNKYALENAKTELVNKLVTEKDFIISTTHDYAMEIFKIILDRMDDTNSIVQESIRSLVTEKAITAFFSADEDNFIKLYSKIEALGRINNIIIPNELMKEDNRDKLLSYTQRGSEQCRWNFIVDVLCNYVMVQNIPADQLSMNNQMGQLIGSIVMSRVSSDVNNGFDIIAGIIDKFTHDWNYLINMAVNIESALLNLPDSLQILNNMWKSVYQAIVEKQSSNIIHIYSFLLSHNRYEQLFDIFKELMTVAESSKSAKELLILVLERNLVLDFADELIIIALEGVPIGTPSREDEEFLSSLINYYHKTPITGRLLIMASGMLIAKSGCKADLDIAIEKIKALAGDATINLSDLQTTDSEKYFEWIVPCILNFCESASDLILNYKLFKHTNDSSLIFINICAKEALKKGKGGKEFNRILIFLEFLFSVGNADERKITGEIFTKLKKRKLKNLDTLIKDQFKGNQNYLSQWKDIHEIAATANSMLKRVRNIFKRKGKKVANNNETQKS